MIRVEEKPAAHVAVINQTNSLPSLVKRAAQQLANASTAAEILDAKESASVAYDAAKKAARFAKAKNAHDEVISAVYRAQADALEIESMAKRRLADEYDAAQERGEVQKRGGDGSSKAELPTAADIGLTKKDIHEARQVRDAEVAEPGIVRRVLDDKIEAGQEPNKAALREAVTQAAIRGVRGAPAPSNKNPLYRAPTQAGAAWTHLYGTCRGLNEWATQSNRLLALHGLAERTDNQVANIRAIKECAAFLNEIVESFDAE